MRYHVTIGSRTFEVEIAGEQVTIAGETFAVELLQVGGTPLRRLLVDGESHRLVAARGAARGEWDLHIDGFRIAAEVVDERTRAIRALTARPGVSQGPKPVRAPMPGMVVRVEVQPGDQVKAGQGVVIIEAMKMENELKAEAAGTVAKIVVPAGTAVEKGAVLIEFATHE
ncbi:MAG: biotin/lipoyl-containing protein [Gemmatimonadota bacterium]